MPRVREQVLLQAAIIVALVVGLRLIADHPLHHRLMRALSDRAGVVSVHRCGPAALTVDFPDWDELQLELGCSLWLERHLPR